MIQGDLPTGWQWKTIGEVCRVVPGFAFKSKDWTTDGIPVVKIKNIRSDCTVDVSEADCVPEAIVTEKLNKFRLGKGDILIAMTGATAGKVGWLSADGGFLLNQRVAKLEPIGINKLFFWGVVSGRRYQELFFHLADGAAQPNMSGKQIEGVTIPVPPAAVQESIAGVVSAYDELIENNTRRIAILEEMARRLYEEWFVRFRFPGHETAEFDGDLPRGWEMLTLGEAAANFDRKRKPLSKMQRAERSGPYPYYGAAKVFDYIDDYIFDGRYLLLAEDGSVATPEGFPVLQFVSGKFWPNNHTHILQGVGRFSTEFLYLALSRHPIMAYVTGAAQPKITQTNMNRIPITAAPTAIHAQFDELVVPFTRQVEKLEKTNANLRAQRDLLLPKLISGEIDVIGAEAALEAAE